MVLRLHLLFCQITDQRTQTGGPKEDRQKMAEMHSKMASCLKSDRPMDECRNEMMSSCQKMMGEDGCPMMGKQGMMKGNMRGMKGQGKKQKEAQEAYE